MSASKTQQLRAILGDDAVDLMQSTCRQAGPAVTMPRWVNITTRMDGIERTYEADWVKHLMRVIARDMETH